MPNFTIYNGVVTTGKGTQIYGIDGGSGQFTVASAQNVSGTTYYYILFGPSA